MQFLPDGGRGYETPEGSKLYPSITTVLSVRNKKVNFIHLNSAEFA